jgi:hypothetical protein
VAGDGIPGDRDGLAGELERDGAADRVRGAVAGLPGAEFLLGVFYRDLDGPSRGVLSMTWAGPACASVVTRARS